MILSGCENLEHHRGQRDIHIQRIEREESVKPQTNAKLLITTFHVQGLFSSKAMGSSCLNGTKKPPLYMPGSYH